MLHVGILPNHDRWGDVLHNLRYVVVDEAHVYRGVFGSHVGNVLRRLRRLARAYGADPQFLLASATIANPGELALALTGRPATVVESDSSARPERDIVLWNPALLDPELGIRASALSEASLLMAGLVSRGLRTICFAKSRKAAELIHRFTADRVDVATAARLAPYRAGYTPAQRREIERRLMDGELLGVSATDALELGIDIGELDCAISVGFPGTVASLRQQWGRAGRRSHGLGRSRRERGRTRPVLHARAGGPARAAGRGNAPRPRQPAHSRPTRLRGRLRGAADGRRRGHARAGGAPAGGACSRSSRARPQGSSGRGATRPRHGSPSAPATAIRSRSSMRRPDPSSGSQSASERTPPSTRERSTSTSASSTSFASSTASPAPLSSSRPASTGTPRSRRTPRRRSSSRSGRDRVAGVELQFGRVSVTEQVIAYQRKAIGDGSTLEVVPLILPEVTFETEAVWFCPVPEPPGGARGDAEAPRRASCGRARAHLAAAPVGDVRSLGHRRPLHEHPLPDRAPDRLRLRRPRRAESGSPSVASTASTAGWRTLRACSRAARAPTAAPPACRARSAAT